MKMLLPRVLLSAFLLSAMSVGASAAPVPAALSDEKLKDLALKLNDLTTTAAMDEKLKELAKEKDTAKRMVKLAAVMQKEAKEKEKPFKFNAALVLGKLAHNSKDYANAELFFDFCTDSAIKLQSGSKLALAYDSLIDLYWDQKKYQTVEDLCQKVMESDIESKEMNNAKGFALERLIQAKALRGDTDEAMKMVERLVPLDKDGWSILNLKAYVQRNANKFDDAIETYTEVLKRVDADKKLEDEKKKTISKNVRYVMTGVYVDLGKIDKAADILQALIKEDPDAATYYNDLGFIWADHDMKFEESEKLIRKALELDEKARKKLLDEGKIDAELAKKQNAAYLDSLGWVLFKNKKYEEAKKYLIEATKDDDDGQHLEIWDHLADAHIALKETKEAIALWTKALKFDDVTKRDAERRKKITEKLKKAKASLKETPKEDKKDDAKSTSFGTFEFVVPAKWTSKKPEREKTAVLLLLNPTDDEKAEGMFKVDIGTPKLDSAKEMAKSFVGKDSKVVPEPVTVDGVDGFKVVTDSTDFKRPKFVIVVYRKDQAYMIMAAQTKDTDVTDTFNGIINSWKWTK